MNQCIRPLIIFSCTTVLSVLPSYKSYASPGVLSVHISINRESTREKFNTETGVFWVKTEVKNTGNDKLAITVWTQYGWSWVSDDLAVAPDIEALKNSPHKITLSPGEEYKSKVEMHTTRRIRGPLTFRLGFVPNTDKPVSAVPGIKGRKDVIWSNPVTLKQ